MEQRRDLLKNSSDSLLLSILAQQPLYGYKIVKELEQKSQGYFKFKEGTLYPALHRLEKAGLIEGKWKALFGGQQRKYYYITEKGYATLADKRSSWNEFLNAMNLIISTEGNR